jgi:hypothetical protein
MGFASLLLDGMTSSGIFLQSAYKIPANFNDAVARMEPTGRANARPTMNSAKSGAQIA